MSDEVPLGPGSYTVDRVEGDYVVLEALDGATLDLPRSLAPAEAAAGDIIVVELEGGAGWTRATLRIDAAATRHAREAVAARLERLRERDSGADRIV